MSHGEDTPLSSWTPCVNKVSYPYITWHRYFLNLWYFCYIYITLDSIFCIYLWNIWSSSFFVVICLVQLYVILVRNRMFYDNWKQIIKFSYHFLLCNKYHVYLLRKQNWNLQLYFFDPFWWCFMYNFLHFYISCMQFVRTWLLKFTMEWPPRAMSTLKCTCPLKKSDHIRLTMIMTKVSEPNIDYSFMKGLLYLSDVHLKV